jgi:cytochrome oxidase Cu insertion factor (SCO1/SenC/PrrC family)
MALLGAAFAGAVLTGVAVGAAARLTATTPESGGVQASELHGQATWPAGDRAASPFSLRDQSGRPVSLTSLRGRVVLLTFLDSRCVDACPVAGQFLADVERHLDLAERPLLVVVGINPSGDTPESVRVTARRWGWQPGWRWLSGSRQELERVWRSYGVTVRPLPRSIAHDAAVYLVDRSGHLRAGYLVPFSPLVLARDVERITRGSS